MKHITTLATMFSLTLLIGCGGGGGGSTAGTGTPTGTGGAPTALGGLPTDDGGGGLPTGDDGSDRVEIPKVSHPPETKSIGGRVVTIGGDDGVPALSVLNNFQPTITSSTIQTIREMAVTHHPTETYRNGLPVRQVTLYVSPVTEIGKYDGSEQYTNCTSTLSCYTRLPGDPVSRPALHSVFLYWVLPDPPKMRFFDINSSSAITDLSLITKSPGVIDGHYSDGHTPYFADLSYESRTTPTATIGDVSFARGHLTAIRKYNNTPLEFQTFAGWLDGSIFATIQMSIGDSGVSSRDRYRFVSYYLRGSGDSTAPSGTGSATWEGAAVASIKDIVSIKDGWSFIRGDATIDIDDLANPDVDLRFDNWKTIDGREVSLLATTFDNVPLTERQGYDYDTQTYFKDGYYGSFKERVGTEGYRYRVEGWFHGENGREVGGIFNTETLSGAFGAVRQE